MKARKYEEFNYTARIGGNTGKLEEKRNINGNNKARLRIARVTILCTNGTHAQYISLFIRACKAYVLREAMQFLRIFVKDLKHIFKVSVSWQGQAGDASVYAYSNRTLKIKINTLIGSTGSRNH